MREQEKEGGGRGSESPDQPRFSKFVRAATLLVLIVMPMVMMLLMFNLHHTTFHNHKAQLSAMDARRVQRQRAARLMNTSEDQADFIPPYVDSKNNATRTEGSGGPGAGTSAKFAVAAGEKTAHNHSFSRKHNRNGTEAKGGHGGGKRAPGKKIEKTGDGVPLRVREAAKDFVYKEGEKVLRVQMLSVLFVPERRSYAFDFSVLRVRSADCAWFVLG